VNGSVTQHVVESKCPSTSNFGTFAFCSRATQQQANLMVFKNKTNKKDMTFNLKQYPADGSG